MPDQGAEVKFRADIEGLRGVAVLLVVLSHAHVPGFSGGFIGVDVFFVISGYLITGLLYREVERKQAVDYWAFYARRVRRLAPALLVMLSVVFGLCLAFMPHALLAPQLESGVWAAAWLSNFHFALGQFDYFGNSAQDSLVLHTWSLGVEEQFYLLWPVMVVFAWRHLHSQRTWLVWAIAASFSLSLMLMPLDATSAYYLMPTRLWQLALGGLVFQWTAGNQPSPVARHAGKLGLAGLGLLVAAMLFIDGNSTYPGLLALLPAFSAALLLAAGIDGTNPVARVIASSWLRLPGKISYSWYLWHWPIFVIGPLLGLWQLQGVQSTAVILISFLVSWLSYAWVEQPFRHRLPGASRTIVLASILGSVLAASLLQQLAWSSGAKAVEDRQELAWRQRMLPMVSIPSVYRDSRCDQWYHSSELVPCDIPVEGSGDNGTLLLIADSVGTQWAPAVEHVARVRGMRLQILTKSSCPIVDEPFVYPRIHRRFTECEQWRDLAVEHAKKIRPSMVIIGSTSSYGFSQTQWIEGSQRLLRRLREAAGQVVVIAPTPILPFHGPRCLMMNAKDSPQGLQVEGCSADLADSEQAEVLAALRLAVAGVSGAHLLYMNELVCPGGRCEAYRNGRMVFRDEQHLNADMAAALGPEFEERLPSSLPDTANR